MQNAQIGELIVGAYLRIIEECQFVTYNREAPGTGNQAETDVVALKSEDGHETVYGCEVVTHLDGVRYSTSKDASAWEEFGSADESLKRLWDKFESSYRLVTETSPKADDTALQFWSPVVREGNMTRGLDELQDRFQAQHDVTIDLIYNGRYGEKIDEMRALAQDDIATRDEPAFRFLQILEHQRE